MWYLKPMFSDYNYSINKPITKTFFGDIIEKEDYDKMINKKIELNIAGTLKEDISIKQKENTISVLLKDGRKWNYQYDFTIDSVDAEYKYGLLKIQVNEKKEEAKEVNIK